MAADNDASSSILGIHIDDEGNLTNLANLAFGQIPADTIEEEEN
jgi:hypothetical protein